MTAEEMKTGHQPHVASHCSDRSASGGGCVATWLIIQMLPTRKRVLFFLKEASCRAKELEARDDLVSFFCPSPAAT